MRRPRKLYKATRSNRQAAVLLVLTGHPGDIWVSRTVPVGDARRRTEGACENTLYSCARCSSSSRMDATFPHLHHTHTSSVFSSRKHSPNCCSRVGCAPVTVIGRAPDGDDRFVKHELVALHCELMCARYEVDAVPVREYFGDVCAEEVARSARGDTPAVDVYEGQ